MDSLSLADFEESGGQEEATTAAKPLNAAHNHTNGEADASLVDPPVENLALLAPSLFLMKPKRSLRGPN